MYGISLITGCLYTVKDSLSQAHKIETPVLFIDFNTFRTNDNFQQVNLCMHKSRNCCLKPCSHSYYRNY